MTSFCARPGSNCVGFDFWALVFTKRSRDHRIPLNSRYHFFDSRNVYSLVTLVKLPIWFSSHNFGEVIQKFQYFQNKREFCMGRPCWMRWVEKVVTGDLTSHNNQGSSGCIFGAVRISGSWKGSSYARRTKSRRFTWISGTLCFEWFCFSSLQDHLVEAKPKEVFKTNLWLSTPRSSRLDTLHCQGKSNQGSEFVWLIMLVKRGETQEGRRRESERVYLKKEDFFQLFHL